MNGPVHAVAGSEDGATVYLGGTFTAVGGQTRANLAAVDADAGVALANWQADTTGVTPDVTALATHGDRLYVGGRFGFIDGRARPRLAALDQLGDVVTSFIRVPTGACGRSRCPRTVPPCTWAADSPASEAGSSLGHRGGLVSRRRRNLVQPGGRE